jgi:hypothetical protein
MSKFNSISNKSKAKYYKDNYNAWKKGQLKTTGFFIMFNIFEEKNILQKISGNSLKLYVFLNMHSKNTTGESWFTIDTLSKYFDRTPRTISNWMEELEHLNLIRRIQLEFNGPSHTFLQPY